MQRRHALFHQRVAQFGADRGGQKLLVPVARGLRESLVHPGGHRRAGGLREAADALPVLDRNDPGQDLRGVDPRLLGLVTKPQKGLGLEEELRDRAVRPGLELALQPGDIGIVVARLGVTLGIGADAQGELPILLQRRDQLERMREPVGAGAEPALPFRRIPPQRHDLAHPGTGIAVGNRQRFRA
eukprot:m.18663 g.18663  ORF g.18663 m.18663 type:complete len:185 (+) comp8533_c0_seq1:1100-1654(+)